jgi:hypothetical protein
MAAPPTFNRTDATYPVKIIRNLTSPKYRARNDSHNRVFVDNQDPLITLPRECSQPGEAPASCEPSIKHRRGETVSHGVCSDARLSQDRSPYIASKCVIPARQTLRHCAIYNPCAINFSYFPRGTLASLSAGAHGSRRMYPRRHITRRRPFDCWNADTM